MIKTYKVKYSTMSGRTKKGTVKSTDNKLAKLVTHAKYNALIVYSVTESR